MDVIFSNEIEKGKNFYLTLSDKEEKKYFIDFQTKVYNEYKKILPSDAIMINGQLPILQQVEDIQKYL